jgi:hypothetical protein
MTDASKRHNEISRDLLMRIVKPVIEAGGTTSEVMVILESVVAGVLTACAEIDARDEAHRDGMLMALESGVRQRLEVIPLGRMGDPRH